MFVGYSAGVLWKKVNWLNSFLINCQLDWLAKHNKFIVTSSNCTKCNCIPACLSAGLCTGWQGEVDNRVSFSFRKLVNFDCLLVCCKHSFEPVINSLWWFLIWLGPLPRRPWEVWIMSYEFRNLETELTSLPASAQASAQAGRVHEHLYNQTLCE